MIPTRGTLQLSMHPTPYMGTQAGFGGVPWYHTTTVRGSGRPKLGGWMVGVVKLVSILHLGSFVSRWKGSTTRELTPPNREPAAVHLVLTQT